MKVLYRNIFLIIRISLFLIIFFYDCVLTKFEPMYRSHIKRKHYIFREHHHHLSITLTKIKTVDYIFWLFDENILYKTLARHFGLRVTKNYISWQFHKLLWYVGSVWYGMLGYVEECGFVYRQQVLSCFPIFPLCTDSHETITVRQMPTLPTMQLGCWVTSMEAIHQIIAASSGATKDL